MANIEGYKSLSPVDKNQEFRGLYQLIPPNNSLRLFSEVVLDWKSLEALQQQHDRRHKGPMRRAIEDKYRALIGEALITDFFRTSLTKRFLFEWEQGRSQGKSVLMPLIFGNVAFNEYNLLDVAVANSEGIFGSRAFHIEREAFRASLASGHRELARFEHIDPSIRHKIAGSTFLWRSQMRATYKRSVID